MPTNTYIQTLTSRQWCTYSRGGAERYTQIHVMCTFSMRFSLSLSLSVYVSTFCFYCINVNGIGKLVKFQRNFMKKLRPCDTQIFPHYFCFWSRFLHWRQLKRIQQHWSLVNLLKKKTVLYRTKFESNGEKLKFGNAFFFFFRNQFLYWFCDGMRRIRISFLIGWI